MQYNVDYPLYKLSRNLIECHDIEYHVYSNTTLNIKSNIMRVVNPIKRFIIQETIKKSKMNE